MGEACKQANKQTWQLSVTSALLIRIFTVSLWTFMPPRPASFSVLLNPDGPTVPKFVPWRFGSLVRAMSGFPWGAVIRWTANWAPSNSRARFPTWRRARPRFDQSLVPGIRRAGKTSIERTTGTQPSESREIRACFLVEGALCWLAGGNPQKCKNERSTHHVGDPPPLLNK